MTTRRTFLTMSAAALAAPALPRARARAGLAERAHDQGHGPVRRRQLARHRRTHRDGSAVARARPDHRDREPRRRRRLDRHRAGRQGRARRLHAADPGLRAFRGARGLSQSQLRPGARFPRRHSVRHHPERDGGAPLARLQDRQRSGRGRQKSGKFTYASAGVGSATHWAAERLRLSGGIRSGARAVQGRAGGAHRGDGGPHRFHLHGHVGGAAADPGRQARGARGQLRRTLGRAAERADDARSRAEGLRLQLLDGPVRAGEDAAPPSSSGSMRTPRRRCRCRRCRTGSSRRASSR